MSIKVTRDNFSTDEEYAEHQQRIQEMTARELEYNVKMLQDIRKNQPRETPCQTFYKLKKGIPLSLFIEVYPFNELVDCKFNLPELMELKRLYSTFEESDQQLYIDSFQRLQQVINSILSNKVPGSYGKGFQSWKEQVAANQEVQDVLRNPEPSDREIDEIAYQNYMQTRIPSPTPPAAPPVPSLFGRVKNLFGLGGGRKTSKKMYQKRSKSRSKKSNSHSKKSNSHSKKSRSKSRSNK